MNNPDKLVSVIISTYNSSEFILETLESIKEQTYKNVELIITDDHSKDNTLKVCQDWLNYNNKRFTKTLLIKSEINTGVGANANRGLKHSQGEWIKFLAADDTLKKDCIKDNVEWISHHPEVKVLFSKVEVYKQKFTENNYINTIPGIPFIENSIFANTRTADSQYRLLLVSDRIHFSPSLFIKRDVITSLEGFDERFRYLEDYPLWLNLTRNGYKLHFMDKITVNYRSHSGAINNLYPNGILISNNYFRNETFRRIYIYPNLPWDLRMNQRTRWYFLQIFKIPRLNRNNKKNRIILAFINYLNPFSYYLFMKKRMNKSIRENDFYK